ncbi:S41 family peptidase [Verrucomicrobium sp. BvORR106]|uniref:S41 family peptidase n=1 Tax=Verrucomicrobium sp. BvORR106 TaxID=1403819 RepID=UPI0009DCF476|nr:S41 family peptidase [Verrucomicrobium sp. BvORR106]
MPMSLRLPSTAQLLVCSGLFVAASPSLTAGPLLDQLPQNGVQSAFQILRRDYIRRDDLTYEELNRAALQGLLERLDFGASLQPVVQHAIPTEPNVHAEFLAPDVAYLRPDTFAPGEGVLFEKALAGLVEKQAKQLILDLRSASTAGVFDEAALMLQCFLPEGQLMFKLKQMGRDEAEFFISKRAPSWTQEVIVLIDDDSSPAAEAVAACLKGKGQAILVGSKTRGATVRYTDVRLDDATMLRYASAELLLPDGTSTFRKGLEPQFFLKGSAEDKRKVFAGSRGKSMKPFVMDRVRPRFNEAALVSGGNPEVDAYVKKSQGQPLPGDEGQLREVVVQRALDLVRSRTTLAGFALKWEMDTTPATPSADQAGADTIPKAVPAKPAGPAVPVPASPTPASSPSQTPSR